MRLQLPSSISRSSVSPQGVEEHLIDPFDQLAVAARMSFDLVPRGRGRGGVVEHGDATLELRRGDGEADGRRREPMMSAGSGSTTGDVPRTGIHQQVA